MDAVEHSGAPTDQPSGGRAPALARAACCGRCGWRPRFGRVALQRSGRRRPGASGGGRGRAAARGRAGAVPGPRAPAVQHGPGRPRAAAQLLRHQRAGAPGRAAAPLPAPRPAWRGPSGEPGLRSAGPGMGGRAGLEAGPSALRDACRDAAARPPSAARRRATHAQARQRRARPDPTGRRPRGQPPARPGRGGGAACARAAPSRARLRRSAIALGG